MCRSVCNQSRLSASTMQNIAMARQPSDAGNPIESPPESAVMLGRALQ
jgi:hypothetical protein